MQFYLLLIILLMSGCAGNKKQTLSESSSEPVIARYGIEPELFWINKYSMGSKLDDFELSRASTTYYDPLSNKYYYATIEKTNNIIYDTNNIQNEKAHINYNPCWYTWDGDLVELEDSLIYIGSIDFLHRTYIDTNGQQYLKTLSEIDTSYYMDFDKGKLLTAQNPLTPIITNVHEHDPVNKEYFFTDGCTIFRLTEDGFKALYKMDWCL